MALRQIEFDKIYENAVRYGQKVKNNSLPSSSATTVKNNSFEQIYHNAVKNVQREKNTPAVSFSDSAGVYKPDVYHEDTVKKVYEKNILKNTATDLNYNTGKRADTSINSLKSKNTATLSEGTRRQLESQGAYYTTKYKDQTGYMMDSAAKGLAGGLLQAGDTFRQKVTEDIAGETGKVKRELYDYSMKAGYYPLQESKLKEKVKKLDWVKNNTAPDKNSTGYRLLESSEADIEKATEGMGAAGQFLTGIGTNTLQNAYLVPFSTLNPGLATVIMAISTAGRTAKASADKGASLDEAFTRGTIDGGIEYYTGLLGMDTIAEMLTGRGDSIVKQIFRNVYSEASEEGLSYLAGYMTDKLDNNPDAKFSLQELRQNMLAGGLSGGILGGGAAAVGGAFNGNSVTGEKSINPKLQQNSSVYGMSAEDEIRYMYTGVRHATRKEKARIAEKGESPFIRTKQEFKSFLNRILNNEVQGETKTYGVASQRLRDAVYEKSGGRIDISGMFMEVLSDDIKHSYTGHLKAKEKGNIDLSLKDYENIPEYIESFDDIIYAEKTGQGIRIQIGKKINGYTVITEIVSNERNAVKFRNMWGVSTESYEKKYKNRGHANQANTLKVSSAQSGAHLYFDNSISQSNQTMQAAKTTAENNPDTDSHILSVEQKEGINEIREYAEVTGGEIKAAGFDMYGDILLEIEEDGKTFYASVSPNGKTIYSHKGGRIVESVSFAGNYSKNKAVEKPNSGLKNAAGKSIIKTNSISLSGKPNSISQVTHQKGGIDRNYYDGFGRQMKQISNNDHGHPKAHKYGRKGEHAHDYIYDDTGKLIARPARELSEDERKENGDIL